MLYIIYKKGHINWIKGNCIF